MARVPLKEGLLSTLDPQSDPRLLGARCADCRQHHFPATDSCPYCSSARCTVVPLGAHGTLYVHTAVQKAPPGYRGAVPYGIGVVELPEAIRVLTRLTEARVDQLAPGRSMRLVLEDLFVDDAGNTVVGWAFAPQESR